MKYDIILAGVGGQGILSIAFVIDNAALKENLYFKQSEVHGMAQRGGAVVAQIRISDKEIFSDLVPKGTGDLILSVEPLEALRYIEFLDKEKGVVVSSLNPVKNIPDYPEEEKLFEFMTNFKKYILIDSNYIAKQAGTTKAQNMVMLGAASYFLPLKQENLKEFIGVLFKRKGDKVIKMNHIAFDAGLLAGKLFLKTGYYNYKHVEHLIDFTAVTEDEINLVAEILTSDKRDDFLAFLKENSPKKLNLSVENLKKAMESSDFKHLL